MQWHPDLKFLHISTNSIVPCIHVCTEYILLSLDIGVTAVGSFRPRNTTRWLNKEFSWLEEPHESQDVVGLWIDVMCNPISESSSH